MTPPSVLLEWSFLDALVEQTHEGRADAHARYSELLDAYERHELRLRARHDHLHRVARAIRGSLLAPVAAIQVAGQHRRAARRLELPFHVDHDIAITLVVLRRERISAVASLHPVFDTIDLVELR